MYDISTELSNYVALFTSFAEKPAVLNDIHDALTRGICITIPPYIWDKSQLMLPDLL